MPTSFCQMGAICVQIMSSEVGSVQALVVFHAPMEKHYYGPHQINRKELEDIGDSFLANGDGFFVKGSFRRINLDPKYKSLLESPNDRT